MNAFEQLTANLLRREGYWIYPSYTVSLNREEKLRLGKHPHPRLEIDILGYQPQPNTLVWVECKSYPDSSGVSVAAFDGRDVKGASRYKVFANELVREIPTGRLRQQLMQERLCLPNPGSSTASGGKGAAGRLGGADAPF